MSFNIVPDTQYEYIEREIKEAREEGFLEGYQTAKNELLTIVGIYGHDEMLWDELWRWMNKDIKGSTSFSPGRFD